VPTARPSTRSFGDCLPGNRDGKMVVPWRLRLQGFFPDRGERGRARLGWSYLGKHAARDTGQSGHRRGGFRDRSSLAERSKFPGSLPVPSGKDSLFLRPSGKTDLPLLRMRGGGVGFSFSDEGPQPVVWRGSRGSGRTVWSFDPVREGAGPRTSTGGPVPDSPGRLRNVPRIAPFVPRRGWCPGVPSTERDHSGGRTGILSRVRRGGEGPSRGSRARGSRSGPGGGGGTSCLPRGRRVPGAVPGKGDLSHCGREGANLRLRCPRDRRYSPQVPQLPGIAGVP